MIAKRDVGTAPELAACLRHPASRRATVSVSLFGVANANDDILVIPSFTSGRVPLASIHSTSF